MCLELLSRCERHWALLCLDAESVDMAVMAASCFERRSEVQTLRKTTALCALCISDTSLIVPVWVQENIVGLVARVDEVC